MGLFGNETNEEKRIKKRIDELVGKRFTVAEYTKNKLIAKGIDLTNFIEIKNQLNNELKEGNLSYDDIEIRIDEIIDEIDVIIKKKVEEDELKEKFKNVLYHKDMDNDYINKMINLDMHNLADKEAGTKWMRIGTMVSMNSTEQMIGAGFKAIIDQNKILIRQNELLRRQNELIIEKLYTK